jgi:hypothetical protein
VTVAIGDEPTRKIAKRDIAAALAEPAPPPIPPAPVPPAAVPEAALSKAPAVVHTTPETRPEPPPERRSKPEAEAPPKELWAKTGNELPIAIATPPPPPPKIPAKPAVNKAIYGGFGPPKKKA